MELLYKINKLYYKNSIELLPTLYAVYFEYVKPSKSNVIFTLGSTSQESEPPERKRNGIPMSIDIIHGNFDSFKDGDSFRVVSRGKKVYIVEGITFIDKHKNNPCQTMIAQNIREDKLWNC
jgi:predicted phosphodiesterase